MNAIWIYEKKVFQERETDLPIALSKINSQLFIADGYDHRNKVVNCPLVIPNKFTSEPHFFYGSLDTAKAIFHNKSQAIVVFCNLDLFKCSYYYCLFGKFLAQQNHCFFPYGELIQKKNWLLRSFSKKQQVFIRPDDGDKTFTGQLVNADTWESDIIHAGFHEISPERMCVVSEPLEIRSEWRLVVGCKFNEDSNFEPYIITGSYYKKEFEPFESNEVPHKVYEFARKLLEEVNYHPDPFWIMDICETDDGLFLLETGGMSTCGLYACNICQIVESLSEFLKLEHEYFYEKK